MCGLCVWWVYMVCVVYVWWVYMVCVYGGYIWYVCVCIIWLDGWFKEKLKSVKCMICKCGSNRIQIDNEYKQIKHVYNTDYIHSCTDYFPREVV
jgi:hypothetical protein